MSLNVGELVAYLRLDMGDFESGMAKGTAAADKLDGKNVDVKVEADTGVAEAKLAAVAASENAVDDGNKKIAKSGNDAGRGMGALATAIIMLGPALVPIAAGAAGLAAGLGAMGVAGILAVVGIVQEMKKGTPLGLAYTGMLTTLKGDLTTLGRTAASGTLAPFQQAVADLQRRMPALNTIVGEFSGITGRTAGVLVTGLVAAFISLAPLARDAGVYILGLSTKFAGMMSGPGVVSFGDYVRSVFPQVMQAVESVVGAVFHLVAALAPLGLGTLGILRVFADVINALPVDVLAILAQGAVSVYIGFKTFSMLSGGILAVSVALEKVGVAGGIAATGMRGLNIAAGAIGILITAATLIFSAHAESVRKDQAAVNDLTDALRASNGAIDESIRKQTYASLAESGAIATAKQYGISLADVTNDALNNAEAHARVTAAVDAAQAKNAAMSATMLGTTKNIDGTTSALGGANVGLGAHGAALTAADTKLTAMQATIASYNTTLDASQQALSDEAIATGKVGTVATVASAAQATLALANLNAATATDAQKTAINALNTAMGAELARALQLAGATTGYDQALLTMNTTLKANNGTMSQHTQKGIDDRRSIEGVVGSLQQQRDTQIKATGSTADATAKYNTNSVALLAQMGRLYGTKSAAYQYAAQLLAIPKSVKTQVGLDISAATRALNSLLHSIPNQKTITLLVQAGSSNAAALAAVNNQNKRNGMSGGGLIGQAGRYLGGLIGRAGGGGLLVGPGTSTSDSITGVDASGVPIVRVSRDEFVVNAAAYAKNKALVNAINDGTQGFAGGGAVGRGGGGSVAPVVYVQNPFTGEYLLGKVSNVVDGHFQALGDKLRYAGS